MKDKFSYKFYKSKAWQDCRAGYIKSVYALCERCQCPGHIVHHKISLTPNNITNPVITLNWEQLEYLCLRCHNDEHGVGKPAEVIREGLCFDSKGDVVKSETD